MTHTLKHRNFDDNIVAYIAARPGQYFCCFSLGKQFGVQTRTMRQHLEGIVVAGRVKVASVQGKRKFYVPTPEQEAEAVKVQAEVRPFRPYVVPKAMRELIDSLRDERERFPSFFGGAA